ncbi:TPA: hypothetical protein KJY76_004304 [Shigella flexneri]|nr:hypothetical protein [Shigella flexneri]
MRGERMLVRGQNLANLRMSESVVVGSFADSTDPETGDPARVVQHERYTGMARIRWGSREVSNSQATGSPAAMQEPYLSVPFGTARFFTDDEVECVASSDPLLVGRRFKVSGGASAGQVTAYRYPLEELS